MRTYVLFHADCYDGFGAAYAASKVLRDVEYIPVRYGDPVPDLEAGSKVYLLDFCPKAHELLDLWRQSTSVTVLDHHKSAISVLDMVANAIREECGKPAYHYMQDTGRSMHWNRSPHCPCTFHAKLTTSQSAAVIASHHFAPNQTSPLLLRYVQDADLWRWKLPESRAVNAYIRTHPMEFEIWERLEEQLRTSDGINRAATVGSAVVRHVQGIVELACRFHQVQAFGEHVVPWVNSPVYRSEIGERLLEMHPNAPFAIIHYQDAGGDVNFSLRSRSNEFDVSEIARLHGGGGHATAASFRVSVESPLIPEVPSFSPHINAQC